MTQLLNVKYSVSGETIRNLDGKFQAPPVSDLDQRGRVTSRLMEIVSRDLHSSGNTHKVTQEVFGQSERCHATRLIRTNFGRRVTAEMLRSAHLVAAPDAPRAGQFRVRRVSVDTGNIHHGFVTATIDVAKHLTTALDNVNRLEQSSAKVIALIYALSFIHPFEDGNGRTIRIMTPIAGCNASLRGYAFWLFFSILAKIQGRRLAQALSELDQGSPQAAINFYDRSVALFKIFRDEVKPSKECPLTLTILKDIIDENERRTLFQ